MAMRRADCEALVIALLTETADPLASAAIWLAGFAIYLVGALAPAVGILWVVYWALTLPMRRSERARLFIDIVEMGLNEGQTPEQTIIEAASSRDRTLGVGFQNLAKLLGQGLRLGIALEATGDFLPRRLTCMLQAGEKIGDLKKVLGACRLTIGESVSQVRGAMNYLVVLAFVVTPATVIMPLVMRAGILPKFKMVFVSMFDGLPLPGFTRAVIGGVGWMSVVQFVLLGVLWGAAVAYVAGPRASRLVASAAPALPDTVAWRVPWKRKRAQRDFVSMLGVLLDAGTPEDEALTLAGEASGNRVLKDRANEAVARLKSGVKLPEAMRVVDAGGEMDWRLRNALRRSGGFGSALSGWTEMLGAKAFQQEQAAAHLVTTGLLLLNGAMVGALVVGLFLGLVAMIEVALLW